MSLSIDRADFLASGKPASIAAPCVPPTSPSARTVSPPTVPGRRSPRSTRSGPHRRTSKTNRTSRRKRLTGKRRRRGHSLACRMRGWR